MRIATGIMTGVAAVILMAAAASASFTTEVIFSGEGWYLGDAGSQLDHGYGRFEELSTFYTVESDMPTGSHHLYFAPDISMQLRVEPPGGVPSHYVHVGPSGIDFDGQKVGWSALGLTWATGYGLSLGEHVMQSIDPNAVVGNHSWDLDGGGADFTATVWANKGPVNVFSPAPYRADFAMHRSFTWLSGRDIGTWLGGGLSPLLGGLPLDSLNDALSGFAPGLVGWDPGYYDISYEGSVVLKACATPVPEPTTMFLLSGGLLALVASGRRRWRQV